MNIKVSIIIPVYKVEKYIAKCIHSLLEQSMPEIEIIVVDDKGLDKSIEIVQEIQQSHPRGSIIQLIEMPSNVGAAIARNEGIKIAKGEYIAFVDSDDWCEPTMYENLYAIAKANDSDFSYCDAVKDFSNGKKKILEQASVEPGMITQEKRAFMLTHFVVYFWTSIYKRSFLMEHEITFPKGRYSEDSYFFWLVLMYAQSFAVQNKAYYHYLVHETSVSNTSDANKYLLKIDLYNQLLKDFKGRGLFHKFEKELVFLYAKKAYLVPLFIYISQTKNIKRTEISKISSTFYAEFPNATSNVYIKKNISVRLAIFFFKRAPLLSANLVSILKLHKFFSL